MAMDWIPIVSQAKSALQAACGDKKGALRTQINFSRECPLVSQIRTSIEMARGDMVAAEKTVAAQVAMLSKLANGIPGVGHAKGLIHYAYEDAESGNKAMRAATRSTGAAIGGMGGLFLGGPICAAAGGMAGAASVDGIVNGVEAGFGVIGGGAYQPSGYVAAARAIVKGDEHGYRAGAVFDAIGMVLNDALSGVAAGEALCEALEVASTFPAAGRWQGQAKRHRLHEEHGITESAGTPAMLDEEWEDRGHAEIAPTDPPTTQCHLAHCSRVAAGTPDAWRGDSALRDVHRGQVCDALRSARNPTLLTNHRRGHHSKLSAHMRHLQ